MIAWNGWPYRVVSLFDDLGVVLIAVFLFAGLALGFAWVVRRTGERKAALRVAIFACLLFLVGVGLFGSEVRHLPHYLKLRQEGRLWASCGEFLEWQEEGSKPEEMICRARFVNKGSATWSKGKHYFALGLFERDYRGRRQLSPVKLLRMDGGADSPNSDRLIISKPIEQGKRWVAHFKLMFPNRLENRRLRFQMVQEGITWFGQEIEVEVHMVFEERR